MHETKVRSGGAKGTVPPAPATTPESEPAGQRPNSDCPYPLPFHSQPGAHLPALRPQALNDRSVSFRSFLDCPPSDSSMPASRTFRRNVRLILPVDHAFLP